MEFVHTQKYILTSPRKLREVARVIKKLSPQKAVETLPFVEKRAAIVLSKVMKTAIANAKNRGVSPEDLLIKDIQIGEGPRLKRGRAASRSRWHPYQKKMSHVRVVLETKQKPEVEKNVVEEKKAEKEMTKAKDEKQNKKGEKSKKTK